jgi:hypothetical protein
VKGQEGLKERVVRAAEAALADHHYVTPADVFCGIGWVAAVNVEAWRKGRIETLEEMIQGSPEKISAAMSMLHEWALAKRLTPSEGTYVRTTRAGSADLQFSMTGDPEIERRYRMRYLSPELPGPKQEQLQKKLNQVEPPVVFQILRDSTCSECGVEIEQGSLLFMEAKQPLCLACALMDDLEYLSAGDTALTRRATKYSGRTAVVVRFSRSRGRYERQGILVEPAALQKAEHECTQDADARAAARAAAAVAREKGDCELVSRMTERIRDLFPGIAANEAAAIARHTATRGSGRVGRTAAGRNLEEGPLVAAVRAAVRHNRTRYDELLAEGMDRELARFEVGDQVEKILEKWRG